MLDTLEAYLEASTSPELCALVLDACKTLDQAGVTSHHFLLQNAIDIDENTERDVIQDGIVGTLLTIFIASLKQFGLQLDEDVTLRQANSILKGLQIIDNWDDPDTLNALTDPIEGNESALADILTIVSDLTVGEYMQAIVSVSDDLLKRIRTVTDKNIAEPQPDSVLVAAAQMRLRPLIQKGGFGEDSLFVHALDNGLRLGMPFNSLVGPYLEQIYELPLSHLGRELVAFAYASSSPTDSVPDLLNKFKESLQLSITDLLDLDGQIKRLL